MLSVSAPAKKSLFTKTQILPLSQERFYLFMPIYLFIYLCLQQEASAELLQLIKIKIVNLFKLLILEEKN